MDSSERRQRSPDFPTRNSFNRPHETYLEPTLSTDPDSEQLPPIVVPPYWHHVRGASRNSVLSIGKPQPIRLEDNTEESEGTRSPLWAKLVSIDSHTVVTGNVKSVGDYVVWRCKVQTLDVS